MSVIFIFGLLKESAMATKHKSKPALQAVESAMMRSMRIDGSHNGATLHTRVVKDKTKYCRNLKHKKSLADAGDFPFIALGLACVLTNYRRAAGSYFKRLE